MDKDIVNYINEQNEKHKSQYLDEQFQSLKRLTNTINEVSKPLSQLLLKLQQTLPQPIFNNVLANTFASILLTHSKNIDEAIQNIKIMEKKIIKLDKEFNKQK